MADSPTPWDALAGPPSPARQRKAGVAQGRASTGSLSPSQLSLNVCAFNVCVRRLRSTSISKLCFPMLSDWAWPQNTARFRVSFPPSSHVFNHYLLRDSTPGSILSTSVLSTSNSVLAATEHRAPTQHLQCSRRSLSPEAFPCSAMDRC